MECVKLPVRDATCPDTFAPSYSSHATLADGEVTALAENRKSTKYNSLPSLTAVAIETSGAIGLKSGVFLRNYSLVGSLGSPLFAINKVKKQNNEITMKKKTKKKTRGPKFWLISQEIKNKSIDLKSVEEMCCKSRAKSTMLAQLCCIARNERLLYPRLI